MSSNSRPPVLVTGGAGYVGAHACKALASRGFLPVTYDNLVYGHRAAAQWGPLEVGDIADRATLDAAIARHKPVAVMHFAAFTYVGESVADPGKYYRNNVAGTLTLLEAMRDAGIERLVFSSTAAVYGTPKSVPIQEDTAGFPINPYGQSKWTAEQMITDFAAAHMIRAVRLRYFNAAGADPENHIGEQHDPESHLIPLAIHAVTGGGPPLTLFGDDYPTPDGTCIRDYIHVTDLADAHVRALDWLGSNEGAHAMNLGTGRGQSVRQVIDAVARVAGKPVPHSIGQRRAGDPAELVADPSLAMRQLGWSPQLSDLDTIVNTAWAWQQRGKTWSD